jgi:hypothetical protein
MIGGYHRRRHQQEDVMTKQLARLGACVVSLVGLPVGLMAQAPPAAPKPGPEHKRLEYFVGTWTTEGEIKPGPMGPGGKMTSSDSCEWFDGGFTVICRGQGTTPMGPSKSLGMLGYSADEKVYTYYGIDSSGMSMTTVPRGTLTGDTWTYTDESQMGGQKVKSRVTIKELSPTAYTFMMEVQGPDGKWVPLMESKSTKK